jgi:ornithine cyclodeaminase/alanine dehydrogenase-like protein (mu-crystallin family)
MAGHLVPPLRYLDASDVQAAMPDLGERLHLAERTMRALAGATGEAELPSKIGVHPRPDGSFVHAMPAHLRGPDPAGADDLLGMKWVAGFSTNNATGLPAIHALVILNDPATGVPTAILDGGPITAYRTAAVSGVAIGHYAPIVVGRSPRAALIGAGVQGHSHLPVLGRVLPGVELALYDRHPERAAALATEARTTVGIASVRVEADARSAIRAADVVVTAASFGPVRQVMTDDWLDDDTLIVPVDYATYCAADVARHAALFLVDERAQFVANRAAGLFDGYPDPAGTLGEALAGNWPRPPAGRVVVSHLGVGLADVIFGDAILSRAQALGLGTILRG